MKTVILNFVLGTTLFVCALTTALAQEPTPLLTQPPEKLIAILKSDAPQKEKADACRELAVVGGKDAVPALAGLLSDEKLSHMARYGLEPIPDPSVDEAFRAALNSLKGRPLVGVIVSIGVRKDAQAVEALAKLLKDSDSDVVQAAARSLGKIANPAAVEALQNAVGTASERNQLAVCEGLLRCAESLQANGDRQSATSIYDQLRRLNGAHHVRTAALRGAILARGDQGASLLREELLNDNYLLFAAAVRTSYELPGAGVTEALAAQLPKLTDSDRKRMVILALGKRADAAAVSALTAAAKNGSDPIRVASIKALAETRSPSAAPALAELSAAGQREISQAALESLASLQGPNVDRVVLAMMKSENASRRVAGIELIGRRRMTACLPDLIAAVRDSDAKVRPAALSEIGELGTASTIPTVLEALPKLNAAEDLEAAEQALSALCAKGEPEVCANQLTASFSQVQPAHQAILLRVLSSVGNSEALQTVRTALKNSNPEVHAAALRALGAWKSADAAPDLLELARNASNPTDRTLSLRAYLGLASNPDIRGNQRLDMCKEAAGLAKTDEEKRLLLSALSGINLPDAAVEAVRYLADTATKEEATAAIATISDRLLKGQRSAQAAPRLIEPLEKAAQVEVGANQTLGKQVKDLLQQARTKARR